MLEKSPYDNADEVLSREAVPILKVGEMSPAKSSKRRMTPIAKLSDHRESVGGHLVVCNRETTLNKLVKMSSFVNSEKTDIENSFAKRSLSGGTIR